MEIVSDCKSVVGTMQHILDGGSVLKRIADRDLWNRVHQLAAGRNDVYRIRWMPSHLCDQGNEEKRTKYMALGLVDDMDIKHNGEADELAKNGALKHTVNGEKLRLKEELAQVTEIAQFMAVNLWEKFRNWKPPEEGLKRTCVRDSLDTVGAQRGTCSLASDLGFLNVRMMTERKATRTRTSSSR